MNDEVAVFVAIGDENIQTGRMYPHRRQGVESTSFVYDDRFLRRQTQNEHAKEAADERGGHKWQSPGCFVERRREKHGRFVAHHPPERPPRLDIAVPRHKLARCTMGG